MGNSLEYMVKAPTLLPEKAAGTLFPQAGARILSLLSLWILWKVFGSLLSVAEEQLAPSLS
jgi:hypothetical protein